MRLSQDYIKKLVKFAVIGALGSVINLAILFILTNYFHLFYVTSEIIAIIIVFVFNYNGNIIMKNIEIRN